MSPQEAAQAAFIIANREHLPLALVAKCESGVAGAVDWFTGHIQHFFLPESDDGVETVSDKQLRRYIAWMRAPQ